MRQAAIAAAVVAVACSRDASPALGSRAQAGPLPRGLHVEGSALIDAGRAVRLLGVNHSGGEYACVKAGGYSVFDSAADDALVGAMLGWRVNTVRLPLNEACWLGLAGVKPAYAGAPYRSAVSAFVARFRRRGVYVVLDLHWSAPGTNVPTEQQPMADEDHSPDFWRSVAATFKADAGVIFDVFNEPYLSPENIVGGVDPWECLARGCTAKLQRGLEGTYRTAGTQALVDAVRSTGAQNVVLVPGLAFTSDLSGWLTHAPNDATGNLAASLHLYNFNACTNAACWDAQLLPVAARVPLVAGELGEDDCAHGFIDAFMGWADRTKTSYLGWTWNVWGCNKGPSLVSDLAGTPTPFGEGLRDHLRASHDAGL